MIWIAAYLVLAIGTPVGLAAWTAWRERAAVALRHRWGRDCCGYWRHVGGLRVRCTRCGARHTLTSHEARMAWVHEETLTMAVRTATVVGVMELAMEREQAE